ncbi:MAG TPA: fumarylacetoacetate hydrolase family protein [Candidatus Acidoferrales bacterium]|jgi:2-keto-4-pentenoate hydratase/2-oxohepta-3-ene-1,7-dioic acid hydratase in catechol pathway|nr:fumarylacetoacetate hydrolase family protein [Candidatus Acidoferrales bacterium]
MRICLFDENRLGVVKNETVRDVTSALEKLPSRRYPFPQGDALIGALPSLRDAINATAQTSSEKKLSEVRLLSPVANPSKVMGAPVNYQKHLNEVTSDPNLHHQNKAHMQAIHQSGFFLKANSSIVGPSEGVAIRHTDRRTDEEVELALVIGRRAQNVPAAEALDYLAGYCIGLDISIRGPEERSLRKSVDTYTVLGPWLVTADELRDPSRLDLQITVNGELRQKANTRDLILGIPELIEFASSFYTLMPGDVLLTGTPEGVGPIHPGDIMRATIQGIGEMTVHVRAAS